MKTVWKFELRPIEHQALSMPRGAVVLAVQTQGDHVYMWAEVDDTERKEDRYFGVFGTGNPLPDDPDMQYRGTGMLFNTTSVYHVYELSV